MDTSNIDEQAQWNIVDAEKLIQFKWELMCLSKQLNITLASTWQAGSADNLEDINDLETF